MPQLPAWLQDAVNTVVSFVPRLLLFLVIVVIGWLVGKALEKVIAKILEKVGFDRLVQRGGVGRAMRENDYDASAILGRLVFYAVMLFALQLAFGVFGSNPVSALITSIIGFLPQLFIAVLIVIIGSAIAGAVADLIRSAMGGLPSGRLLATAAQVFIIGLALIAALNQVGIALTVTLPVLIAVLATVGGIAVVGVGGGLVTPMRRRWEGWLDSAEQEGARVRRHRALATDGRPGADGGSADANGNARNADGFSQEPTRNSTWEAPTGERVSPTAPGLGHPVDNDPAWSPTSPTPPTSSTSPTRPRTDGGLAP